MKKQIITALSVFLVTPAISATSVDIGYKAYTSETKDDNGGAYEQPFVKLTHFNKADWGTLLAYIKLENVGEVKDAQDDKDGKLTVKSLIVVDKQIAKTKYNYWAQNFLSSNRTVMEDNLYLGVTTNRKYGDLFINAGAGLNYTAASFSPTGAHFDGLSGYAAVINASYPFSALGLKHSLAVNYEGQFDRDEEHMSTLAYDSYGHQIITTLKTSISQSFYTKLHLTHFDSWGAAPNDGIEYGVSVGFTF
ncbi:outer membrane protein OmpK [Shewanella sp. D64]|uniref:outer membrane protein OmpK n=1 Tax=unclassified Shewanella TaxID=196818 RepID=UPI0022BA237D|nr:MULTISPECIES: outer membrane protein OmpK [unclassified Shewanella]MEC4728972.1 outer membrane protein OmpK [Shewanella sp. D64]MEC4740816.1 outer membrane protein OmpK [Shewanella sp. E94]WBJ94788.1 outer membrane protein OmpK [Shewanella sp. MTB7]